jgi:hypothetical protein
MFLKQDLLQDTRVGNSLRESCFSRLAGHRVQRLGKRRPAVRVLLFENPPGWSNLGVLWLCPQQDHHSKKKMAKYAKTLRNASAFRRHSQTNLRT